MSEQSLFFNKLGGLPKTEGDTTEKIKGQDPDLLDLYNVRVKKSAVPNATQNVTSLAGANNSNVKSNNQNVNSPLLYQDEDPSLYGVHNLSEEALKHVFS